jgi:GNAT superfamily N-acetyltransferase
MKVHVAVSSPIQLTGRVRQMAGLFDVPLEEKLALSWDHDLPLDGKPWNVGLIYGPSGAGKTLLATKLWPERVVKDYPWPVDKSVIDGFPDGMSTRAITGLLSSVGFGSPPAWMRPYRTLSNGEAFRATVARALAEIDGLVVLDEFTSVVDRQVAKVASHTVQKAVRRESRQLVAVTCHYDVEEWLQPDWVYDVAAQQFTWRSVQPHPPLTFNIHKCERSLWPMFARHHYLSANIHTAAKCFAAYENETGKPVAFTSYRLLPHPKVRDIMLGHRLVVLPDWQGLGLAGRLDDWLGQYLYERGLRYRNTIAHPAMIHFYAHSPRWRMVSKPKAQVATGRHRGPKRGGMVSLAIDPRSLGTRSFEYVPVR